MKLQTVGARGLFAVALVISAILVADPAKELAAGPRAQSSLRVEVVEGNGETNSIGKENPSPRQITVRVNDEANKPIIGATVFFQMPADQTPGGAINGQRTTAIYTDDDGLAKITIQPNKLIGPFKIDVVASFRGVTTSSVVTQINEQAAVNGNIGKLRSVLGGKASAVISAVVGAQPATGTESTDNTKGLRSTLSGGEDLPTFAQITTLKSALNGVNPVTFGVPMGARLTAGDAAMNFTAASSASWFTVSPTSGIIPANSDVVISIVSVNATDLPDGPTGGVVTISAPGYQDNTHMQLSLNCGTTDARGEAQCTIRMTVSNPK